MSVRWGARCARPGHCTLLRCQDAVIPVHAVLLPGVMLAGLHRCLHNTVFKTKLVND